MRTKKPNCKCGANDWKYNKKYDSYYCGVCFFWYDKKCSDPECDFCKNRPGKASCDIGMEKPRT